MKNIRRLLVAFIALLAVVFMSACQRTEAPVAEVSLEVAANEQPTLYARAYQAGVQ